MNVCDILVQWLGDNGYDGLWNPEGECGCKKDDINVCGEPLGDCKPGYKGPTRKDSEHYEEGLGKEKDFMIYATKKEAKKAIEERVGESQL